METAAPEVRFRPLTRDDLPTLARWLAEPLVARWWSENSPDRVEQDFGPYLDDAQTECLVVIVDGEDAGILMRYPIAAEPSGVDELTRAGIEVPDGAWSMDYLIAEPAARGRGAGAAMVARAVAGIWDGHPEATCVIVPVNIENPRSWGALVRAGFRRLPDAELTPDNPGDTPLHAICRIDRPLPPAGPPRSVTG
ncbi:GNAT family N-acetyltransferase [Dietzia maris]|uniref:Lysine N-acyltransferase MbtK n=1 Tax=Dietzia maris TaxID=37915 RepID=A0AAE4U4B2_9ACTN|nr:GNAT family N-acetyltransferase [Dietzia maris]MDV6298722.1 GNAT family N-acetyltransferase [Dietzia maris]